jgi:endonuclease/exonuclease/phosphatase family metal-dependent hydrolase
MPTGRHTGSDGGYTAGVTRLRLATLNVWGWYYPAGSQEAKAGPGNRQPAWSARQSALAAALGAEQPDLVAFQEAITVPGYDQVSELLGPGYQVVHARLREPDGSGATIASRWPVTAVHEIDLPVNERGTDLPAVTLVAEVDAPAPIGPLLLANHTNSWQLGHEYEREVQAVTAARALAGLAGASGRHTLLAGDFNASPDAASMRFWRGLQSLAGVSVSYRDAWQTLHPDDPGHTFSLRNPNLSAGTWPQETGRRIDYLLVRCVGHGPTLNVARCALLADRPVDGVWPSDHFGVVADLTPPDRPPGD